MYPHKRKTLGRHLIIPFSILGFSNSLLKLCSTPQLQAQENGSGLSAEHEKIRSKHGRSRSPSLLCRYCSPICCVPSHETNGILSHNICLFSFFLNLFCFDLVMFVCRDGKKERGWGKTSKGSKDILEWKTNRTLLVCLFFIFEVLDFHCYVGLNLCSVWLLRIRRNLLLVGMVDTLSNSDWVEELI